MTRVKPTALLFAAVLLAAATLAAQAGRGSITGTVTTDQGDPAQGVTIQAKDAAGMIVSATASRTGRFTVANLAPGIYEISVPQMGLRTSRYAQPDVVVEAGKTLTLNIKLMPNNFGIVGDDAAFLQMYNKYKDLKGPTPRMPDGHPDF